MNTTLFQYHWWELKVPDLEQLLFSFLFSIFPFVHTPMHVCKYACTCVYILSCMWWPEAVISNHPQPLFTLFIEAGSLSQKQGSLIRLVWLASLLWGSHLHFPRLSLQVGCHTTPAWHLCGFQGSCPDVCMGSALTTEQSPQLFTKDLNQLLPSPVAWFHVSFSSFNIHGIYMTYKADVTSGSSSSLFPSPFLPLFLFFLPSFSPPFLPCPTWENHETQSGWAYCPEGAPPLSSNQSDC